MEPKKVVRPPARDDAIFVVVIGVILGVVTIGIIASGPPPNPVFGGNTVEIQPTGGTYHINGTGTINFRMVSDDCFTLEKDDFTAVIKICGGNAPLGWSHYTFDWWGLSFPTYSEGSGTISPGGWHFTEGSAVMLLTSDQPIAVIITPDRSTSMFRTWTLIISLVVAIAIVLFGIWAIAISRPDKKPEEKPKEPEEQKKE